MAGTDGAATDLLLRTGRWFTRGEVSPDLRTVTKAGGRAGDVFYRDRWSHDTAAAAAACRKSSCARPV